MQSKEKVIDKAEKLLRLSRSASQEEAATAFAMASALLAKHGLGIDEINIDSNQEVKVDFGFLDMEFVEQSGRVMRWKVDLLWSIGMEHSCRVWWVQKKGIVLLGHKKNRETVKYLYQSIVDQIDIMVKYRAYGKGGKYVNAYRHGCVDTIRERIKNSTQKMIQDEYAHLAGNGMALIRLDQLVAVRKDLETQVEARMPKLSKGAGKRISNADGYFAGRKDGERVHIGKETNKLKG